MTTAPLAGAAVPALSPGVFSGGTAAVAPKKELDSEVFLALLVAQLRNQDPSSPMDTTEMMAQSTQLATMEQLTSLTDTSREAFSLQMRIAASSLVGREVSFVAEDGATGTGVVSAVTFDGPVPTVTVGGATVPLDAVSQVRETTTAPSGATPTATTTGPASDTAPAPSTTPAA